MTTSLPSMAIMDSEESDAYDSDKELQIAFHKGALKPGLNIEAKPTENFINDVAGLEAALNDLKNDLPWVQRLDLTLDPTLAPRQVDELLDAAQQEEDDDVHNDFKREMKFYRQAQAAVLAGIPRLQKMNIPTKRPEDYFAQMAKSDSHMKKVREKLLAKKVSIEQSEKAKKLRDLRKFGKKVQQEVMQRRHKDKREMLDAVKKYKKGQQAKLDFLQDQKNSLKGGKKLPENRQMKPSEKRNYKNSKFGFGGQKKRSKYNTADSSASLGSYSVKQNSHSKKQGAKLRPGKSRRQNMKNKKRKR